jgi:hypothetical protein
VTQVGFARTARTEPFYNVGGHPVGEYLDLTVDQTPLLRVIEQAASDHFDVVTPVTEEFPQGAVEFLEAMLGIDDLWSISLGAEAGEVPIYVCPVDYDLLCGGIVAKIARTEDTVRLFNFRHTSTDDEYNETVTAALQGLSYGFDRPAFDDVLGQTRIEFIERARTWVRPDDQVSAVRRWGRRVRRRLQG